MMVVRNTFVAKPGQASKLAAQLKTTAEAAKMPNFRVLTDVTGDFNRVVLEYQVDSISGFEKQMKEYASNEVFKNGLKGYTDLYQSGTREILQIV